MTNAAATNAPLRIWNVGCPQMSHGAQFAVVSTLIFLVYQFYAYFQEFIVTVEGWKYAWFMATWTFAVSVACAALERAQAGERVRRAPLTSHALCGALSFACQGLTMVSLNHVNYPIMVVFKSSKVIPVMIAGLFVQRKHYSPQEYGAAGLFFAGLALFTLADVQLQPKFDKLGILCLTVAIVGDAFVGNVQERVLKRSQASVAELTQYSYSFAAALAFLCALLNGEIGPAFALCNKRPILYPYLLGLSVCSFGGVSLVLTLVDRFGAVTAVVVTSARKILTIVLSFVFFPKPFSVMYVWASLLLFVGMVLQGTIKKPKAPTVVSIPDAPRLENGLSPPSPSLRYKPSAAFADGGELPEGRSPAPSR